MRSDKKPEGTNHAKARPGIVSRLTAMHEAWVKEATP
jgi:hypothetical protein